MLQEPPASQYDLRFELFGYPIRVAWGFWLVAAILGWGWAGDLNLHADRLEMDSPGAPVLLLIWIAAIFLSILVHEFGHSLAMSYYGSNSRIVLYHFGGLAIPDSFGAWNSARQRRTGPREQIVISAAGPVFQLALALVVWAIGYVLGVRMNLMGMEIGSTSVYPGSAAVYGLFNFIVGPSVFWALLNLAPILPLDGGNILKNGLLLTNVNQPARAAHMVSVGTGVVLGLYFLQGGNALAGIMFFMFAANNWQAMQFGSGSY